MSFLDDLHSRLSQEQNLTASRVCEIIADEWGGERLYIVKLPRVDVDRKTRPADLIEKGIPKTTAYRKIRKSWVSDW